MPSLIFETGLVLETSFEIVAWVFAEVFDKQGAINKLKFLELITRKLNALFGQTFRQMYSCTFMAGETGILTFHAFVIKWLHIQRLTAILVAHIANYD